MRIRGVLGISTSDGGVQSSLLVLLAAVVLASGVSGCGSSSKGTGSLSQASVANQFRGDEDDDDESAEKPGSNGDTDADFDNDAKDKALGYHDIDDGSVLAYGHAPSAADEQTLAAIVKRYHAAAVAEDGATACSMTTARAVKAIPVDYGQAPGPVYLRGKTCAAVMSLLFKHNHTEIASPSEITGVRVSGNEALVLLGSRAVPASVVILQREGGVWKVMGTGERQLP
jgi:hypothetical protein